MKSNDSFSSWLDDQLRHLGISGKELAIKVDVSEATISRIRNGRIPLSPRLKARLSQVLNAPIQDVPQTHHNAPVPLRKLLTVQHSTPDYAIVNYALKQGLFLNHGIDADEAADQDVGQRHSEDYYRAIKGFISKGHSVLAVGPKSEFIDNNLTPSLSIPSHIYCGYHVITRACTTLPSLDEAPIHQRVFTLKILLEQLENAEIWRDNFERVSWQSKIDYEFLQLLQRLSAEMIGMDLPIKTATGNKFSNKAGLDSLHAVGRQGADIVIGGCAMLADAYTQPDKYKVLLSLDKIVKTISAFSMETSPVLLSSFAKLYRADKATVALARFKNNWLEKFANAEKPIFWHLLCAADIDEANQKHLMQGVAAVQQDVQQELAAQHLRDTVLQEVKQYTDARTFRPHDHPCSESFRLAWNSSFKGI